VEDIARRGELVVGREGEDDAGDDRRQRHPEHLPADQPGKGVAICLPVDDFGQGAVCTHLVSLSYALSMAPVIRPVTSCGEESATRLSATLVPRRSTISRSQTAKMSGIRWLISTTAMPWSLSRRMRLSTSATWRTEIAAVGSSMSTILGSESRVRAMATACL